jgi:hypothetical protein
MEAHRRAEDARVDLGLSVEALWVAYVGLGGSGTLPELDRYLADGGFTGVQHDYVAQALNDCYVGLGGDHPVPYSEMFEGTL